MNSYVPYEEHARKARLLFDELVSALGSNLSENERHGLNALIGCGELDDAIESILDLSGASHLFVIPSSFAPEIEDWLNDFGTPGPDDDDYVWYAAKRAMEYSREQESAALAPV